MPGVDDLWRDLALAEKLLERGGCDAEAGRLIGNSIDAVELELARRPGAAVPVPAMFDELLLAAQLARARELERVEVKREP
jgi:hypothetical protein